MRKIKIIILIIFCLLLIAGCNAGKEEVAIPEEEPVVEEEGQLMLTLGMDHELDLDLDGEQEKLTVHHNEVTGASANVSYFVDEQLQESVSELQGLERTILFAEYQVIQNEAKLVLALYVDGKQEREVYFYVIREDMTFTYLGRITGEVDFFDMGGIELLDNQVSLDGRNFDLDPTFPDIPLMDQNKDEALDYLALPVYSIISGYGEPDMEEMVGSEKKLAYIDRDIEIFLEQDKIKRICTASGSLLDIEIGKAFLEEDWRANERYALLELATSAEEYKMARFDFDKYFVECTLKMTEQGMEVAALCVSLSELDQARLYEEHVLVDRFGDLLFAETEGSWSKLFGASDGWTQVEILGYERENAVLFFQAQKSGVIGVYYYNLLGEQLILLAEEPQTAAFSGGLLSVSLIDGRKYFDLGGLDVTTEIMGPEEDVITVEFYVQSDTLFYLPTDVKDYVVLKELSQFL
jgi:hypothetical protein